jgi:agmatinase
MDHGVNPFKNWATVTDCGDIPNTPFDKLQAIRQLESGWVSINAQSPKNMRIMDSVRIISIGGDHTIS